MAASPRKRISFKFLLDLMKPQEQYLIDVIKWLTEHDQFLPAIRDGLRLIYDLRFRHDTSSLLEMFPDIRERLQIEQPSAGGGGELEELRAMRGMMEMLLAQRAKDDRYDMQSSIPAAGPKPLKVPTFAMPIFEEDDEPVLNIAASKKNDSALNFVTALRNMQ